MLMVVTGEKMNLCSRDQRKLDDVSAQERCEVLCVVCCCVLPLSVSVSVSVCVCVCVKCEV
jgi:hypothetical protein